MNALNWQKSSYSEYGSSCVYLAASPAGSIHLCESDTPHAVLSTIPDRLHPLISGIKAGRFDRAAALVS
ncbi:DUF397 domain-containing protein [Streptomyces sp. NPDC021096]|uniref:DUF397 domain-containing protein n=1 Tax=Streptomyces sp. NPDC021096 TaxID=3154792 RepID=UPI0033D28B15